jgi:hypothetical protein
MAAPSKNTGKKIEQATARPSKRVCNICHRRLMTNEIQAVLIIEPMKSRKFVYRHRGDCR